MEAYLDKGIKEVITEFPLVEGILDEYGIGCGPCSVGTCRLKDIVEIHSLPSDQEQEMLARLADVIAPGKVIRIPRRKKSVAVPQEKHKFSPPMRKLVDEHVLIKRWIALLPVVIETLDLESGEGRGTVLGAVEFIRSYADRYHHAKEEDILFGYFDENTDILKVMYEDHRQARAHVKAMQAAIKGGDRETLAEHMKAHGELLTEHIRKEDEILFPWMDRALSVTHVGELHSRFARTDKEFGDAPAESAAFIEKLERTLKHREV